MKHEDSPEWYYMSKENNEKVGPIGFQEVSFCQIFHFVYYIMFYYVINTQMILL